MKPLLVAAAIFVLAPTLQALNPNRLLSQVQKTHWQIEDGLPHNYVNAIALGPDGYLLIGTDDGLARFDGLRFSAPPLDDALHLDRRWILSLHPSRRGGYWVGTYDRSVYWIENGRARDHFATGAAVQGLFEDSRGDIWYQAAGSTHRREPSGLDHLYPQCGGNLGNAWSVFAEDTKGSVWIARMTGLCRYRGGAAENVLTTNSREGVALTLLSESDGSLWLGTSSGLFRVVHPDSTPRLERVTGVAGPVSCLLRDHDGVLWAGTWGNGLFRIAPGSIASWSSRDGLADDFIRTLFEDPEGNLWFGSRSGGLNRWKDTIIEPFGIPEGMTGNFASAISGDGSGALWLGTYRSGLYRLDQGKIAPFPTPAPALDLVFGALAHDSGGHLWVGAWSGFFRYSSGRYTEFSNRLPEDCSGPVSIAFDPLRRLWVGCSGGLYRFPDADPRPGVATPFLQGKDVRCLLAASDGSMWAGTSQGLAHVSGNREEWFTPAEGLPDPNVRYLSEDLAHRIWVTTNAPGLTLAVGHGLRTLDARNGLPNHGLYKPIDDGAGALWVSSSRGIVEIPTAQIVEWIGGARTALDVVGHDLDDGMRSIECHGASQPGGWRNNDGSLWFPTTKGFIRIQPSRRRHLPPPAVVIEEARAGGKRLPLGSLRLPPGARDIEVRFTALRFGSADHVSFRYQLEGSGSEWTIAGRDRVIRLAGLSPGAYRLLVAARDAGGEWTMTPAVLSIEQLPLFRQTLLFKLLLAAVAAVMATLFYGWRIRRLRGQYAAVTAERNRIAREWHDTLLAGLSGVSWQLEAVRARLRSQPEQAPAALDTARKMVDHCSAEARRVIWDLRDSAPENPTLPKAVAAFLSKLCEGAAIGGKLEVGGEYVKLSYDLEHNALRVIQEGIVNAIHHGRPSRIDIVLEYTAKQLMLQVRDDGGGFIPGNPGSAGHFGILGMRERVLSFGGQFEIFSAPGRGAVVSASFPIERGGAI